MRRFVFLKFQHADKRQGLSVLPRERITHFAPALADIAIRAPAKLPRYTLGVQGKRSHARKLVFRSNFADTRAYFLQLGITAAIAAIGHAEQRLMPKLPRRAL